MDVHRRLFRSGTFTSYADVPAALRPNAGRRRFVRLFTGVRAAVWATVRPIRDAERFGRRDLVRRDVDGKPAHDIELTPPGTRCSPFLGGVGPAHYHTGRRSTDGARLVAFAGTACPAASECGPDISTVDGLRIAS